ncbi:MAG: hypothetical protein Q8N04_14795 [Nitrospira sp.]|nr:hypothetical protein [Nitrospira sp.]
MMPDNKAPISEFDWRVTSFEGARREQLRRWARLPLEHILLAIEEMQDIAQAFGTAPAGEHDAPSPGRGGREEGALGFPIGS